MKIKLKNKNILVTGASGFLGAQIVKTLEGMGAIVFAIDNVDEPGGSYKVDITDENQVRGYLNDIEVPIDGVVNCAAVSFKSNNLSSKKFNKTLKVNVGGAYNVIKTVSSRLSENASIVNIASVYGMISPDFNIYDGNEELFNSCAYGSSKGALLQLTRYYANLLAPVRVNAVSPGGIFQGHKNSFSEKYSANVPLKRMADPQEVVNAIVFLLSDLSSYITGVNLPVTGGLEIK